MILADFKELIVKYMGMVEYIRAPLCEIVSQTLASGEGSLGFLKECGGIFSETGDFPKAWKSSIAHDAPPLTRAELALLVSFGEGAGAMDPEGEIARCRMYLENVQRALAAAENDYRDKSAFYRRLSLLLGAAVVVLII